ncbi:MAG: Ig-like domain-containing protein [Planctomycetota bacterium]|nr:Ig-like domain-containing protein [Planctomycetota bacterium]
MASVKTRQLPQGYVSHDTQVGVESDWIQAETGKSVEANVRGNDQLFTEAEISIVSPPAHGLATVLGNGMISYRPHHDFVGTDYLIYASELTDGSVDSGELAVEVR